MFFFLIKYGTKILIFDNWLIIFKSPKLFFVKINFKKPTIPHFCSGPQIKRIIKPLKYNHVYSPSMPHRRSEL